MKRIDHQWINGIEHKLCGKCKNWKLLSEFNRQNDKRDGLYSYCRTCGNTAALQWHYGNREYANENRRRWHRNNRERANDATRQWHTNHPEYSQQYRANHPGYFINKQREALYDITPDEIDILYLQQKGACSICFAPLEYNKIVIEHSHEFNLVRGLVHKHCNTAIGLFEDSVDLLQRAINYLINDYQTSDNPNRIVFTNNKISRKRYLIPLLESQNYKCSICQREITPFESVVDHNHTTNLIRSVLCNRCNVGLGLCHDSVSYIGQAIQYLINAEYRILIHGNVIEGSN